MFNLIFMSKFILNQLSKEELIDLVMKQEERFESVKSDFEFRYDMWAKYESQASYSNAFSMKHADQANHLLDLLSEIGQELNSRNERDSEDVLRNIEDAMHEAKVFATKRGNFTTETLGDYVGIGEKYFANHREKYDGDKGLRAHWAKLKQQKLDEWNS